MLLISVFASDKGYKDRFKTICSLSKYFNKNFIISKHKVKVNNQTKNYFPRLILHKYFFFYMCFLKFIKFKKKSW